MTFHIITTSFLGEKATSSPTKASNEKHGPYLIEKREEEEEENKVFP